MTETVWIVGHGLLGSELESQIRTTTNTDIFHVPAFSWNDRERLASEFSHAVQSFGELVQKTGFHAKDVLTLLSMLELKELAKKIGGDIWIQNR